LACIPTYFLSTLWDHPHPVYYFIGGLGAVFQLAGVYYLLKDFKRMKVENSFTGLLMKLGVYAFVVKLVLQFLSSFPYVADLAYQYRNFIIAYLHLVLLGFISLTGLAFVLRSEKVLISWEMKSAISFFLFSFITTELLLIAQASGGILGFIIPSFPLWIFYFSCLFPLGCLWMAFLTNNYFGSITRTKENKKDVEHLLQCKMNSATSAIGAKG
ncbi:MAG: hypothetical protein ACXWV9_11055, partial [Flavisolibacter sp.]